MKTNKISCCLILKIAVLLIVIALLKMYLAPFSQPDEDHSEPILTTSVCDEVIKQAEIAPVEAYEGELAKVDFSTWPEAELYYTAITKQVAEGPNFAGHFTIAIWGCGTDCAGLAVVDSINGKIICYLPSNEQSNRGNSYSFNLSSRLLVFNPKEDFNHLVGKSLAEVVENDVWEAKKDRQYLLLQNDMAGIDSDPWLHTVCRENALDGVIVRDD